MSVAKTVTPEATWPGMSALYPEMSNSMPSQRTVSDQSPNLPPKTADSSTLTPLALSGLTVLSVILASRGNVAPR